MNTFKEIKPTINQSKPIMFVKLQNARKPDESDHGDPLTLLSLYCAWLREKRDTRGGRAWCRRRGIEEQRLYELTKLAAQLRSLLQVSIKLNLS